MEPERFRGVTAPSALFLVVPSACPPIGGASKTEGLKFDVPWNARVSCEARSLPCVPATYEALLTSTSDRDCAPGFCAGKRGSRRRTCAKPRSDASSRHAAGGGADVPIGFDLARSIHTGGTPGCRGRRRGTGSRNLRLRPGEFAGRSLGGVSVPERLAGQHSGVLRLARTGQRHR